MGGPNFSSTDVSVTDGNLIVNSNTPKLRLNDTSGGGNAHVWDLLASSLTFQLQDVTNSATRIIVDANGRVGIGAGVTELSPHRLTLKDTSTVLSLINGTSGSPLTGSLSMIDSVPYVATDSGGKYRGLSIRPEWSAGGGQVDVIGIGADYNAQLAVSSITHSGATATATIASPHGYATDDWVTIFGATPSEYNGRFQITVTGSTTFTYVMSATPASNASGTIKQAGPSEIGLFIGDIKSYGSGSSYGGHFDITTYDDPAGAAKERGLLITISRRPGCPVANTANSFSRGLEISSAQLAGNLRAGSAIEIYGEWTNGIFVAPEAYYNGFGTTTPNTRLHVAGGGDETIKLETTGGVGAAWSLQVLSADGMLRVSHGSTHAVSFAKATGDVTQYSQWFDHDYTTDAERGRRIYCGGSLRMKLCGTGANSNHGGQAHLIDGSVILGAIRIGTAGTPSYQVHLTNDSAAKPSTSTWTVTSDEKTKTILGPFTSGLDVVRQLNLQTWEYNGQGDTPAGQVASGMVAQDLLPVLPAAVKTTRLRAFVGDTDQAEFLGVDYHLLFLSGLNAVKELDARLTQLQAEVAELRGMVG